MADQTTTTTQINPADARAFVANYHPDPESLKSMPDDAVVKYHERVTGAHTKFVTEAVEKAKKDLVPQKWPDNWRNEIAGDDEKELKQIERYASPKDVWTKARELEKRLSSGEFKRATPFPEKGTDEEKANWRKEAGIPEAPEKYEIPVGKDGKPVADAKLPEVQNLLRAAHAANIPPAHVAATLQFLSEESARVAEQDRLEDEKDQKAADDYLRAEWGTEFRRNQNLVEGLLDGAPKGLKDVLTQTRLADGTLLKNHVDMQRFLVQLALQVNPVSTVLPGHSGDLGQGINDEIAKFEKLMGDRRSEYWKGPKAAENQQRYRDLITARERMAKKAA